MTNTPDFYSQILNYTNTAVVLVNSACAIEYMNQSAEAIFGFSLTKAQGMNVTNMLTNSEADRKALSEAISDAHPFIKRHAEIRDSHGKVTTVDYSVTPFAPECGNYLLIEITAMERLLKISREESILATADTSKQLVRGLAHEVKNPLGGIRGAAQLLSSELDDPDLIEYTEVITQETDRLRNLVDRMLGPNVPPKLCTLNAHEVLERVGRILNAESGNSIRILRDYDPSLPDIVGDTEQLIQAVLNIARNAQQALTESNTVRPQISFRTRIQYRFTLGAVQHNLVARIDIEDNGPGIPEDLIDEIFYPMITGRSEGTGLGLPIAQSLISAHNGLVECNSKPEKTIFSIFLPIISPPITKAEASASRGISDETH